MHVNVVLRSQVSHHRICYNAVHGPIRISQGAAQKTAREEIKKASREPPLTALFCIFSRDVFRAEHN